MKRQFVVGVLVGLAAGSLLRQRKVQGVTQERLDRYYQRRAQNYNLTDVLFSPRVDMRRALLRLADLQPGMRVLDFACGAGANFPLIMERIGAQGHLTGTDYSPEMLDAAQQVVLAGGWQNVTLVQSDAAEMDFDGHFDAIICTMGLAVIPRWEQALERAWALLKPGGVLAIGDISESNRWYARPLAFLMDLIDTAIIADSSRRPWEWLETHAQDYRREEVFHGFFYAAVGRKPAE